MFDSVDAYDRFVGRYSPKLARALIDVAGVKRGQTAIDVGCGPGALTAALVELLGLRKVAAVDPSPPFVEACRRRHPGVRVEQASAESLPFQDATFDAALAQLVVNFMSDAIKGVGEMKRVTRPTGVVAGAVWDYGEGMTLIRTFWDAAAAVEPAGGPRDERNIRFAMPAELDGLWTEVGLVDVNVSAATVTADYGGFDDLWAPLEQGVGPAGAFTVSLSEPRRQALKSELARQLGVGDQPFQLSARAWVVMGRVR